jgi:hypothetical protein
MMDGGIAENITMPLGPGTGIMTTATTHEIITIMDGEDTTEIMMDI